MDSISSLMSRVRKAACLEKSWELYSQPVPLIQLAALPATDKPISSGSTSCTANTTTSPLSRRYVATGITAEAAAILQQLPMPLYIVAFAGLGRSGKSRSATELRAKLTGNHNHKLHSAAGNIPITHGIDMLVFKAPGSRPGHIVFLDCEGGANHNQTALPFVIGLASRLAARMYIFERACFTTNGLDTVMQVFNMGHATSTDEASIPKSIVFVENMSINQEIPNAMLLQDLLNEDDGDEITNRVRGLIKDRFQVEFNKLPYYSGSSHHTSKGGDQDIADLYSDICNEMAQGLVDNLVPFKIGALDGDGAMVVQLINELISQIRGGGSRFNMASATEALVSNMATEAAHTLWDDFITKVRQSGNHPTQVNGRKPLGSIMLEIEKIALETVTDLDNFISRLEPPEAARIGRLTWDKLYCGFQNDLREAYIQKSEEIAQYRVWRDWTHKFVAQVVLRICAVMQQAIWFAKYSLALVSAGNWHALRFGFGMVKTAFYQGHFGVSCLSFLE
ncbi:hypothetical protein BASA60_003679 [Batrachochytrium salamandrivorans]|nr:hypothetical protein BASA60_003679 [Batrachochytrium salamandrivorans]